MTATRQETHRRSSRHLPPEMFDIIVTNPQYETICQASVQQLPVKVRHRVRYSTLRDWWDIAREAVPVRQSGWTLWISRLADIPEDADTPGISSGGRRHLVFVEDMPVEAIPSRIPRLNVRHSRRLHIARERDPDAIGSIIRRVITGMARGHVRSCIVDAWIEGPNLVILSPCFERLYVPTKELDRYLGKDRAHLKVFEIDQDGSYLYWPHADAHFGWEQLQGIVDPSTLVAARRKSREFNAKYGAAIRCLREEHGLRQSDIEGITDRHLRRVEHGHVAATRSVLNALAESHRMSLSDYLAELAERV